MDHEMRRGWRRLGRRLVCAAMLGAAVGWAAEPAAPRAPTPTTEAFAALPLLGDVDLSPSGKALAGLMNVGGATVLFVRDLETGQVNPLSKTDNERMRFRWVKWVNDERLLVSVAFASTRGFVDTTETRLLAFDRKGGEPLNLVRSAPWDHHARAQLQDAVIDWMPEDGRHVLLQLIADGAHSPAVYEVDVYTGRRRQVQPPRRDVWSWLADAQHRVRIGIQSSEGEVEVLARTPEGGEWRLLWRFGGLSSQAVWPLGFGDQPNQLYVRALHEGRWAIFRVDLDQPALPRERVLSHPTLDVDGRLVRSQRTGRIVGLRDSLEDGRHNGWWDPDWRRLLLAIDKGLPDRHNRLLQFSRDENTYLVYSSGNGQPGEYYLGRRDTGDLTLLAEDHAELPAEALAGKRPVRIVARDGLPLQAYLSRPRGDNAGPLPMVLLPHGGPHGRDDGDFDPWTEFLAARGYAVLQVNFRGSSGYGHAFFAAGLRQWGLEMQDDLTDAVQWAVAQGHARHGAVCIVGGSYGGYAALMGAAKTPSLYRCVVSFAGVTDLLDLWDHEAQYVGGAAAMRAQLGERWSDRERLRATSPALQARQIRAPVLLVHGSDDRVVPVDQSRDMAQALRRAGKAYRYVELDGGDHHLGRHGDRLRFFKELEVFLAAHLLQEGGSAVAEVIQ